MRLSAEALARCEGHFNCLSECIGVINAYARARFEERASNTSRSETLRVLLNYQSDRSLGTYCLLVNGLIWDAEIVLRSVYEAFSKLLLVALAAADQAEDLLHEFWTDLPAIYDRKGALKAEMAEAFTREFSSTDARVFAAFRDDRLFDVHPSGNRKSRKEVEKRWSFSGILDAIGRGDFGEFVGIEALGHQYGIASHLAHVSPKAFDLLEDRATRGSERLLLEVSHTCRVCSDLVSLLSFSAHFATCTSEDAQEISPVLRSAFDKMSKEVEADRKEFAASQDEFYQSWGH